MKYSVAIPRPSAKRLKNVNVVVETCEGWAGCGFKRNYPIDADQVSFEFSLPEEFEYVYTTSVIDGSTFNVYAEYSNDKGSRKETISLVPIKI